MRFKDQHILLSCRKFAHSLKGNCDENHSWLIEWGKLRKFVVIPGGALKKILLFCLVILSAATSTAQFRRAIFLHHSVGNCFWDRSRVSNLTPPTTIPKEITNYNNARGYSGSTAVTMDEVYAPDPSSANDNNWYRWDNIINRRDAYGVTLDSFLSSYPVIVIKTCYLATQFMSTADSIRAYKTEWRDMVSFMRAHPNNFFCIWTDYPAATDGHSDRDQWSNLFSIWAKDTLAQGKDSFGAFPPNVYVFDVFHKLASRLDGYCDPIYGSFDEGPGGDHPSNLAVSLIDSAFIRETFDAAIAYEHPLTPVPVTLAATSITSSGATLNGTVNPNGVATSYHFEYGLTQSYGTTTTTQSAGSGSGSVAVSATITGLTAATLYHYRVVATYSGGTVNGNDDTLRTAAAGATPPAAATGAATGITTTGAQLNGTLNPNGFATTYHFEYGLSPSYGVSTAAQNGGAGTSTISASASLSSLSPATVYHFRLVASNTGGTTHGSDSSFTTAALPQQAPATVTLGATGITSTGGVLNGSVDANGLPTTYHFQYGLTKSYGSVTLTVSAGSLTNAIPVSAALSGLSAGTVYHYRLTATNAGGTSLGDDTTFSTLTPAAPPAAATRGATAITASSAQLNGTVNPNGTAATYHFEYGTTSGYGTSTSPQNAGSGTSPLAVNAAIAGLSAATTYHYRVVATDTAGTSRGNDTTFVTAAVVVTPPAVVTGTADSVSTTGCRLTGTVNPNGHATTFHFEYGPTASYGSSTQQGDAGSGTSAVAVSAMLQSLTPGATYHYRIAASNSGGSSFGADSTAATMEIPPPPQAPPKKYVLLQSYPNPFNPTTRIRYGIPAAARVKLIVFNALGQPIATLVDAAQDKGYYEVVFDGTNLASGTYFYRIQAGDYMEVRRILLVH